MPPGGGGHLQGPGAGGRRRHPLDQRRLQGEIFRRIRQPGPAARLRVLRLQLPQLHRAVGGRAEARPRRRSLLQRGHLHRQGEIFHELSENSVLVAIY